MVWKIRYAVCSATVEEMKSLSGLVWRCFLADRSLLQPVRVSVSVTFNDCLDSITLHLPPTLISNALRQQECVYECVRVCASIGKEIRYGRSHWQVLVTVRDRGGEFGFLQT